MAGNGEGSGAGDAGLAGERLAAWREWEFRCALGRCRPYRRRMIERFCHGRFLLLLDRYARRSNRAREEAGEIRPASTAHLFETHCLTSRTRAGKAYKRWIFSRATGDAPARLRALEGGAALILRDVVREHLRAEHTPPFVQSMDQPLRDADGRTIALEDLLPAGGENPMDAADRYEAGQLARQAAANLGPRLPTRDRMILLAQALEIPLSHPRLLSEAACEKSALHRSARILVERVAAYVEDTHGQEPAGAKVRLASLILAELRRLVFLEAESEMGAASFFNRVGGRTSSLPLRRVAER